MSKKVVVNIDDFCDNEWAIVDRLSSLKENYPNFKATLFTIPFKISPDHLVAAKETGWIELPVHGFNHISQEMLTLSSEAVADGFSKIDFSLFERGFRAPYWLMDEKTIRICNEFGMWLAIHHTKNPGEWRKLAKNGYYYPKDTDDFECWYGHTYDIGRELSGLLKKWSQDQEFAFVSEAVQQIVKLNFGIGYHPFGDGFINLEYDKKYIERSRSEDCRIIECDLRDGLEMFASESIDAATVSHTLMYLKREECRKFFLEVYRVLKEGGIFRVTEDNCEVLNPGQYDLPWADAISATGPNVIRKELEEAGFEVHDVSPEETLWVDNSLIQQFHGQPPRVFHIEAVKK